MKKIRSIAAILCCSLALSVPVFGTVNDIQRKSTTVETEKGNVVITSVGEEFVYDTRCIPEFVIHINETAANVLQENDTIYMTLKPKKAEDASALALEYTEVTGENMTADAVILEDEHTLAITIGKREGKKAGTLEIRTDIDIAGWNGSPAKVHDLILDTGSDRENNAFLQQEDIVLHDSVFTLIDAEEKRQRDNAQRLQAYIDKTPLLVFTIGQNTVLWNDTPVSLKHAVFLTEGGTTMIALEDFVALVEKMTKENEFLTMTAEEGVYNIFVPQYQTVLEPEQKQIRSTTKRLLDSFVEKDGVLYLPLREAASALRLENSMIWQGEKQTITIGYVK